MRAVACSRPVQLAFDSDCYRTRPPLAQLLMISELLRPMHKARLKVDIDERGHVGQGKGVDIGDIDPVHTQSKLAVRTNLLNRYQVWRGQKMVPI